MFIADVIFQQKQTKDILIYYWYILGYLHRATKIAIFDVWDTIHEKTSDKCGKAC